MLVMKARKYNDIDTICANIQIKCKYIYFLLKSQQMFHAAVSKLHHKKVTAKVDISDI